MLLQLHVNFSVAVPEREAHYHGVSLSFTITTQCYAWGLRL
jgi:hypothetical protein